MTNATPEEIAAFEARGGTIKRNKEVNKMFLIHWNENSEVFAIQRYADEAALIQAAAAYNIAGANVSAVNEQKDLNVLSISGLVQIYNFCFPDTPVDNFVDNNGSRKRVHKAVTERWSNLKVADPTVVLQNKDLGEKLVIAELSPEAKAKADMKERVAKAKEEAKAKIAEHFSEENKEIAELEAKVKALKAAQKAKFDELASAADTEKQAKIAEAQKVVDEHAALVAINQPRVEELRTELNTLLVDHNIHVANHAAALKALAVAKGVKTPGRPTGPRTPRDPSQPISQARRLGLVHAWMGVVNKTITRLQTELNTSTDEKTTTRLQTGLAAAIAKRDGYQAEIDAAAAPAAPAAEAVSEAAAA